jgi:quercetin dioxygenase-like cupin family protein
MVEWVGMLSCRQFARGETAVPVSNAFTVVDDAAGMAAFEEGRVKPVTVLKATGANVVVFAFDAGTELREHTADEPALLQVLEGNVTVQLTGETVALRPGDLLHIEPGVPHSVEAAERARLQLTILMIDSPGPSHIPAPSLRQS